MATSTPQPQYPLTNLEETTEDTASNGHPYSSNPSQDGDIGEKPVASPGMDLKAFPEGGAAAWLTVAGASACLFVSFGWINCVGVFQEYYQTNQLKQYSASDIAWIPALQSRYLITLGSESESLTMMAVFFMLAGGPFVGKVFDDYGPRYLLAGGACLHVLGLMMTSISKKYYQFLLSQAICSAIGASMVFYPAFSCVSLATGLGATVPHQFLGIDVVLQEARRCPRSGGGWIVFGRCHFSHHGHKADSTGWLWLGSPDLRLPDPGHADFCKFDRTFSPRADKASIRPKSLRPSSEGAAVFPLGRCHLFLLL